MAGSKLAHMRHKENASGDPVQDFGGDEGGQMAKDRGKSIGGCKSRQNRK
jgi:hypothetical protein